MNKHTPGPWIIKKSPFEVINVDHGMLTHEICSGYIMIAAIYVDHDSPDAHLLAAAPELLEALTMGAEINTPDLMDWIADRLVFVHKENPNIDFVKSLRNRAATARAAIAKAKGEQK